MSLSLPFSVFFLLTPSLCLQILDIDRGCRAGIQGGKQAYTPYAPICYTQAVDGIECFFCLVVTYVQVVDHLALGSPPRPGHQSAHAQSTYLVADWNETKGNPWHVCAVGSQWPEATAPGRRTTPVCPGYS